MTSANASGVLLPVRLRPGDDLRRALESIVAGHDVAAAFVVSGIGSLSVTRLRYAGLDEVTRFDGDTELLTLSGSISVDGSHLHASVSDRDGRCFGGHVGYGCSVRTTAEVLLMLLPEWHFSREADAQTGWAELSIRCRGKP